MDGCAIMGKAPAPAGTMNEMRCAMQFKKRQIRVWLKIFVITLIVILYLTVPRDSIPYLSTLLLVGFFVALFAIKTDKTD